jgi:hypothetical protein
MVYVKWVFWGAFWLILAGFLHYTLPQHDTVRISDTYGKRIDFGENSIFWTNQGTGELEGIVNRDVFFIQTVQARNGRVMVYRNEDTGWGWPPYFKFDASNLQAEAGDLRSTAENPKWVAIRHYGWRNEFLSIYPNAVSVTPVAGPDVKKTSWLSVGILIVLAALFWAIRARFKRWIAGKTAEVDEEWALKR